MQTHQELACKLLIRLGVLVAIGGLALAPFPEARAAIEGLALVAALFGVAGRGRPAILFGAAAGLLTWMIYVSLVDSDAGGTNEFIGGLAAPVLGPVVGLLGFGAGKLIRRVGPTGA